jgi:uncharacterized protein (TIGR03435 family)
MVRVALGTAMAAVLVSPLLGQGPEFEVASIKRNTSDRPTAGPPSTPASGQLVLNWMPAKFLVTRAYPELTTPLVVEGAPGWADSEHWDVVVKFRSGASADEQAQMWKTLLTDRMKLAAHYETRSRQAYNLVVARPDGRLGPQLKPSTLDCPEPDPTKPRPRPSPELLNAMAPGATITPAAEQSMMSQCGFSLTSGSTTYAGAIPIQAVVQALMLRARLDRPIIDKTGLQGLYSVKLTFYNSPNPPGPDDPPSVFTALQEQLGLKLEPVTVDGRVLVIDHLERPTEN